MPIRVSSTANELQPMPEQLTKLMLRIACRSGVASVLLLAASVLLASTCLSSQTSPAEDGKLDVVHGNALEGSDKGIAATYPNDRDLSEHPDVIAFYTFGRSLLMKKSRPRSIKATGDIFVVAPKWQGVGFTPFNGSALAFRVKKGSHYGGSFSHLFSPDAPGGQPESLWFRYYLRFGDDWSGEHGKLPGFGGTYGQGGWGGRPSDGTNGWSARGCFRQKDKDRVQVGTYCYHAAMQGDYGDVWNWSIGDRGCLELSRWYCIEQHLQLNTPGKQDGTLKAWVDGELAFDKQGIRFRDSSKLKIERVWCNVFHGGKIPAQSDDHLFIDNLVIATSYVGPLCKPTSAVRQATSIVEDRSTAE